MVKHTPQEATKLMMMYMDNINCRNYFVESLPKKGILCTLLKEIHCGDLMEETVCASWLQVKTKLQDEGTNLYTPPEEKSKKPPYPLFPRGDQDTVIKQILTNIKSCVVPVMEITFQPKSGQTTQDLLTKNQIVPFGLPTPGNNGEWMAGDPEDNGELDMVNPTVNQLMAYKGIQSSPQEPMSFLNQQPRNG